MSQSGEAKLINISSERNFFFLVNFDMLFINLFNFLLQKNYTRFGSVH